MVFIQGSAKDVDRFLERYCVVSEDGRRVLPPPKYVVEIRPATDKDSVYRSTGQRLKL